MKTRSVIIGYTAMLVLLSAGAAQGLSGTNTVDSGDIIDGQVTTPDIRAGAVSESRLLDGAVTGNKVKNQSLVAGEDFGTRAASVSLDFGSIAAFSCASLPALSGGFGTFTKYATALTAPSNFTTNGLAVHAASTTTVSGETLQVVVCNVTAAAKDPSAGAFEIVTFKVP